MSSDDCSLMFFVPGDPQPKERPRARFDRRTNRVQVFTPSATRAYETSVGLYCRRATALIDWAYDAETRFADGLHAVFLWARDGGLRNGRAPSLSESCRLESSTLP